MKPDKATQKVLKQGDAIRDMVKSDGWSEARTRLLRLLVANSDLLGLSTDDPEKMVLEIEARKLAVGIVREWLKDIEGTASQHDAHKELMLEIATEEIVARF
jgi:hypothetical protein